MSQRSELASKWWSGEKAEPSAPSAPCTVPRAMHRAILYHALIEGSIHNSLQLVPPLHLNLILDTGPHPTNASSTQTSFDRPSICLADPNRCHWHVGSAYALVKPREWQSSQAFMVRDEAMGDLGYSGRRALALSDGRDVD